MVAAMPRTLLRDGVLEEREVERDAADRDRWSSVRRRPAADRTEYAGGLGADRDHEPLAAGDQDGLVAERDSENTRTLRHAGGADGHRRRAPLDRHGGEETSPQMLTRIPNRDIPIAEGLERASGEAHRAHNRAAAHLLRPRQVDCHAPGGRRALEDAHRSVPRVAGELDASADGFESGEVMLEPGDGLAEVGRQLGRRVRRGRMPEVAEIET